MKVKNKVFDRRGDVAAPDAKWTGEEPRWDDADNVDAKEYYRRQFRALGFYAYYTSAADLHPEIVAWMKDAKYNATEIKKIADAHPNSLASTVGKFCRLLRRGMPDKHRDADSYFDDLRKEKNQPYKPPMKASSFVKAEIGKLLTELENETPDEKIKTTKKVVTNPHALVQKSVEEKILPELELYLDQLSTTTRDVSPGKIPGFDLSGLCRSHAVPASGLKTILTWVDRHLAEFRGALDKECDQLVAGYSWLSKPQLRKVVEIFESLKDQLKDYSRAKANSRKPRVKKPKAADAQVSKLKYATDSAEYEITSINPSRIPFAQSLFLFNTKNRQLLIYHAQNSSGFLVKGTTLLNYEESNSFAFTCRKPKETLNAVMSMTDKQFAKYIESVAKKRKPVNGRINENMIILKTKETR
jgi:hypothetical protein